jgi:hypothetical protein
MPGSRKTQVIEALFEERWQGPGTPLGESIVTLVQVSAAIRAYNRKNRTSPLSTRNPANFFKDFIRKRKSANDNWPQTVFKRGYTARQITGEGQCFTFVPIEPGQTEPFPGAGVRLNPKAPTHRIQSTSMPLASRRLGRRDEAWLVQVIARLHIVETHLALHYPKPILQIDLLQTNVKLAKAEIDALYLGLEQGAPGEVDEPREVLITCEAKGRGDDILPDQILAQVKAAFRMKGMDQGRVLPMAVKAVAPSRVQVVQFAPVSRADAPQMEALEIASEAIYELVPPVPGVGS